MGNNLNGLVILLQPRLCCFNKTMNFVLPLRTQKVIFTTVPRFEMDALLIRFCLQGSVYSIIGVCVLSYK